MEKADISKRVPGLEIELGNPICEISRLYEFRIRACYVRLTVVIEEYVPVEPLLINICWIAPSIIIPDVLGSDKE